MKFVKRAIVVILILTAVGLLLRGWIYRQLVAYKSVGQRPTYSATDNGLVEYLDANTSDKKALDIDEAIKLSLSITSKQLNFTASKNDNDPNKLISSRNAHCVGYASFFATTCNYILKKHHLDESWTARPQIGQLYFLGTNVHSYFHSPFFRDHDFVTIENKATGELFAVDPTVNDYLWIDFVTYAK